MTIAHSLWRYGRLVSLVIPGIGNRGKGGVRGDRAKDGKRARQGGRDLFAHSSDEDDEYPERSGCNVASVFGHSDEAKAELFDFDAHLPADVIATQKLESQAVGGIVRKTIDGIDQSRYYVSFDIARVCLAVTLMGSEMACSRTLCTFDDAKQKARSSLAKTFCPPRTLSVAHHGYEEASRLSARWACWRRAWLFGMWPPPGMLDEEELPNGEELHIAHDSSGRPEISSSSDETQNISETERSEWLYRRSGLLFSGWPPSSDSHFIHRFFISSVCSPWSRNNVIGFVATRIPVLVY